MEVADEEESVDKGKTLVVIEVNLKANLKRRLSVMGRVWPIIGFVSMLLLGPVHNNKNYYYVSKMFLIKYLLNKYNICFFLESI